MRAVIVEDELNVRKGFIKLMNAFCPEVVVVAEADSVDMGLEVIAKTDFDILFLDINLPDGSGFDLIYQVANKSFQTIFVTAYDQYAIDAFKVGAVDYLLKPVPPESLKKAINRIKQKPLETGNYEGLEIAKKYLDKKHEQKEKIILRDSESMFVIAVSEVVYCMADGAYTTFYLSNRDPITTSLNLKEYERLLKPFGFTRCHNSYLANIQHIVEVKKIEGGTVIMSNKAALPLSTRKKPIVMELLKAKFLS